MHKILKITLLALILSACTKENCHDILTFYSVGITDEAGNPSPIDRTLTTLQNGSVVHCYQRDTLYGDTIFNTRYTVLRNTDLKKTKTVIFKAFYKDSWVIEQTYQAKADECGVTALQGDKDLMIP